MRREVHSDALIIPCRDPKVARSWQVPFSSDLVLNFCRSPEAHRNAAGLKMQLSAIDGLIAEHFDNKSRELTHSPHLQALALQVHHNLQYQHDWASVLLHTHSPTEPTILLPRPLVSGIPPHPVYVHPDRQIELIKAGIEEKDTPSRREWVLPTHLREKWTLRSFGEVFDRIDKTPPSRQEQNGARGVESDEKELKRVLLATVDDDSTVTYYIVHDGVVKPRQN